MNQLKELLDREARRVGADPDAFDSVLRVRDRRQRDRRVGTVVLALAVFGAVIAFLVGTVGTPRSLPANPTPTTAPHHNGEITVRAIVGDEGAIIQIDPTTGHEVTLPIAGVEGWPYGPSTDLAWSPDGMTLAYVLDGVWVLDHSSGESRKITPCGNGPHSCTLAWSPDGSSIAVAHDSEIELVNADGSNRTSLTPLGPGSNVHSPTWSPDGALIAFVGSGAGGSGGLYAIDRSGSGLQLLVDLPPGDTLGVWMPAWSPDGSKIAYLSSGEWSKDKGWLLSVTVVDADGSNPTEILQAGRCLCFGFTPGLAWSPDGTQMALVVPGPGRGPGLNLANVGLYVMDADGTGLRLVREGAWGRPAWRSVP
jgi:Tol biopolymer transport system component